MQEQGQIRCMEKVRQIMCEKDLLHWIRLKVISFIFLAAGVTRRKKKRMNTYHTVHFELSLLFILNGVGQSLSKPPAESKLQMAKLHSGIYLPSVSLVHLQMYFCCLRTTVRTYCALSLFFKPITHSWHCCQTSAVCRFQCKSVQIILL